MLSVLYVDSRGLIHYFTPTEYLGSDNIGIRVQG